MLKNSKSSGRSSYAILGRCLRSNYEHCKLAPPWMAQARPPPCSRFHGCRKPARRHRREPASRRPSPVPPPCPTPPRITTRPTRRPRRHQFAPPWMPQARPMPCAAIAENPPRAACRRCLRPVRLHREPSRARSVACAAMPGRHERERTCVRERGSRVDKVKMNGKG
jgi:hypothetical protein